MDAILKDTSQLLLQLEQRDCPVCQKHFKVVPTSSQMFCSSYCSRQAENNRDAYKNVIEIQSKKMNDRIKAERQKNKERGLRVISNAEEADTDNFIQHYEKKWKAHVVEAQRIVSKMGADRLRVAELAVAACDIKHGGGSHWHKHEGVYTIKRFAEEVGINPKTLSNWIRVKRNVIDKIEPTEFDIEEDWTAANRAADNCDAKASKEEVREAFTRQKGRTDVDKVYHLNLNRKLKTALYFVKHKLNKKTADKKALKETHLLCKAIVEILEGKN